uniref:Cnidarian restricted protein n=1 Tax=Clytia hemisphaerica TaxID=252671 RepID=A0A7M5UZL0_9CNID
MRLLVIFALSVICSADAFCRKFPVWPQDFRWSFAGPIRGMHCTQILETADPHTWKDNYLCHKTGPKYLPVGMKWKSSGPIKNMRCTRIIEIADPHTWRDNFLCVPRNSPFLFEWSMAGPNAGKDCIQWKEPAEPAKHYWNDNYLCADTFPIDDYLK